MVLENMWEFATWGRRYHTWFISPTEKIKSSVLVETNFKNYNGNEVDIGLEMT